MRIYDLIYLSNAEEYELAANAYRATYVDVKLEDASDFVHEYRFSVDFEIGDEEQYHRWLLDQLFTFCSFNWQITSMERPTYITPLMREKLAQLQALKGGA